MVYLMSEVLSDLPLRHRQRNNYGLAVQSGGGVEIHSVGIP
nr:MAG TPA: hypothetical protein [Caudoviricetes sp.]